MGRHGYFRKGRYCDGSVGGRTVLGKRRRQSPWRRLRGEFRLGEDKPADLDDELQRLTVYVTGTVLGRAETQAIRAGFETVQAYCTDLIGRTVDAAHFRDQVAEVEARRGPLLGLNAIADDPEFLADMRAATHPDHGSPPADAPEGLTIRLATGDPASSFAANDAAEIILRHAGRVGDDPHGFLATLRRGEPASPSAVEELARALDDLERQARQKPALDRRLAFALHRLAFESQVLHTDAYPNAFDAPAVRTLRAVQEAVERILSGEDIRYQAEPGPGAPR